VTNRTILTNRTISQLTHVEHSDGPGVQVGHSHEHGVVEAVDLDAAKLAQCRVNHGNVVHHVCGSELGAHRLEALRNIWGNKGALTWAPTADGGGGEVNGQSDKETSGQGVLASTRCIERQV
jgi:hypothetical protein